MGTFIIIRHLPEREAPMGTIDDARDALNAAYTSHEFTAAHTLATLAVAEELQTIRQLLETRKDPDQ